jgi:hypothetical protein
VHRKYAASSQKSYGKKIILQESEEPANKGGKRRSQVYVGRDRERKEKKRKTKNEERKESKQLYVTTKRGKELIACRTSVRSEREVEEARGAVVLSRTESTQSERKGGHLDDVDISAFFVHVFAFHPHSRDLLVTVSQHTFGLAYHDRAS